MRLVVARLLSMSVMLYSSVCFDTITECEGQTDGHISNLFANNSGTKQDTVERKTALQTVQPLLRMRS